MLEVIKDHAHRILCNPELIKEDITYDTLFAVQDMNEDTLKDVSPLVYVMICIILAHSEMVSDKLKILCSSCIIKCAPSIFGKEWMHGPIVSTGYEFRGNKEYVYEVTRNDSREDGSITVKELYNVLPKNLPDNEQLYGDNWQFILNRMNGTAAPPPKNGPNVMLDTYDN